MANKPVKYFLVDAFTDSAFKGNPAAVCLLEEERDDEWLQAVAREFNISQTCFLTRLTESADSVVASVPRFRLRWFTTVAEVKLCGHATLAASHILFAYDMVRSDTIEFSTLSGILTAKRVVDSQPSDSSISENGAFTPDNSLIELDFPVVPVIEYNGATNAEVAMISKSLNGASFNEIYKATTVDDFLVLLASGKAVEEVEPNFVEILKCSGRGLIITAPAPTGSGFDFYSRFFCPKLGIYEASARSGILNLHLDDENKRVLLRGKAVTVMEGTLLV